MEKAMLATKRFVIHYRRILRFIVACFAAAALAYSGIPVLRNCAKPSGNKLPFVMSYRGATSEFPEHTIGAYREAIRQRAQFVECDVVLTHDLVPICRHDPDISETTDVRSIFPHHRLPTTSPTTSASASPTAPSSANLQLQQGPRLHSHHHSGNRLPNSEPHQGISPQTDQDAAFHAACTQAAGSVLASDLSLQDIKRLRALSPVTDRATTATETKTATMATIPQTARTAKAVTVTTHDGGDGSGDDDEDAGQVDTAQEGMGGRERYPPDDDLMRVATLEDLLRMASTAKPVVGVAAHLQAASWHNALPQLVAANRTFEDIVLNVLQSYGYASGPYGSEAWRRRPSYIMAFEAGSLKYLTTLTTSPLTQVLGPTIPDTGETWDAATSPPGLDRIRRYAGSVAVARQQLLEQRPVSSTSTASTLLSTSTCGSGGSGGSCAGTGGHVDVTATGRSVHERARLQVTAVLGRMQAAGLQVFVSVFNPGPQDCPDNSNDDSNSSSSSSPSHRVTPPLQDPCGDDSTVLLPGASSWVDEVRPLVQGHVWADGAREVGGIAHDDGGSSGDVIHGGCSRHIAVDGLFTSSPSLLWKLLSDLQGQDIVDEHGVVSARDDTQNYIPD